MPPIWVDYGNRINQSLTLLGVPELIIPVDAALRQAIGTSEALTKMQKPGYWTIRQPGGNPDFDTWVRQGIEVVPKIDPNGTVWAIGLRRLPSANPGTAQPAPGAAQPAGGGDNDQ
jgi:hypothetical protein